MSEIAPASPPDSLGQSAVELLGELISIDTSNPPNPELPVQELLAERLDRAGFECELLAAEPGRANLIARLAGERDGERLCVLGHADTVPADPDEWSFSPWAGDVEDGFVRGRGAQDMKGQVASEVAACAALAESGWRPQSGELIVVITADEEMGAALGAQWLCTEHPEKVRCEWVLNEGGGIAIEHAGRRHYAIALGEKGVFRFWLRARGRAGHASVPALGDNALVRLAGLLEAVGSGGVEIAGEDAVPLLEALGALEPQAGSGPRPHAREPAELGAAVERLRQTNPEAATYLAQPMLGITMVPTRASASRKDNVIPSSAEALIDCRVPPGMDESDVRARVQELLGGAGGWEIELAERVVGNRSPATSRLADRISEWLERTDPGARLAPVVMPGFSDSHWFRKAFGTVAYGFCPQRAMSLAQAAPLVHGADERAAVGDVDLAARFFFELPQLMLGDR